MPLLHSKLGCLALIHLRHKQMPFLHHLYLVNHQPILSLAQHLVLTHLHLRLQHFLLDLEIHLLLSVHRLLVLQRQQQHHPFLAHPHPRLVPTLRRRHLGHPHPCLILQLRVHLHHLVQAFLATPSHPNYLALQPLQIHSLVLFSVRIPPPLGRLAGLVNQACSAHLRLGLLEAFSQTAHHSRPML